MKILSILFTLFFAGQALAHEDHFLGNGILHYAYHIVFTVLFFALLYKAFNYVKAKRNSDKTQS